MIPQAPIEIRPGDLVTQDPDEEKYYEFNFDRDTLADAPDVTIDSFDITVEVDKPLVVDGVPVLMTTSDEVKATGDRKIRFLLVGGTLGATYRIACQIVTNENPARRPKKSFFVLVQRG